MSLTNLSGAVLLLIVLTFIGVGVESYSTKDTELTYESGAAAASVTVAAASLNVVSSDPVLTVREPQETEAVSADAPVDAPTASVPMIAAQTVSEQTASVPAVPVPSLTVTRGEQPGATLALAGAGGVSFTNFTLTAGDTDVHISSATLERTGPGEDGAFAWIYLADSDGAELGDGFFDAHHRVITREPFTVAAHESKTLSITADMAGDLTLYEGQTPTISVVSIVADVPISGLPITGMPQTVNTTLTIGGATALRGEFDPGIDINRYIGERAIRFAGIRIVANSREDLTLDSITWTQNGTASAADVSDVTTTIDGVSYPTEEDGRTYTSTFSPPLFLAKGRSVEVYLSGNLALRGSQRTLKFDIDESGDVALTGSTYGYGVGIAAEGNTAMSGNSAFITSDGTTDGDEGSPFYSAPQVTISGGTAVTIQNATQ